MSRLGYYYLCFEIGTGKFKAKMHVDTVRQVLLVICLLLLLME